MMSRSTFFTIIVVVLSTLVIADDPCRFEYGPKGVIDLTSLARTDGKAAYPDVTPSMGSNYMYSYNPCKPFSEGSTCVNVAACQVSKDKTLTFILAKQDSAKWNPGAGLDDLPSISYFYNTKQAIVKLQCATDETNKFEVVGESPINVFKFVLTNKCACWDGCRAGPPQQNCSINGSVYTSDKEIIQSLPFSVSINPPQPQPSSPSFSYANVDINGQVIELVLFNIRSIPPAIFCLEQVQVLSFHNSSDLSIPSEIIRLASSLKSFTVSSISYSLTLPPELFNMPLLSTLSIINCGLRVLSEDIVKLTQLTKLTLDQNRLVTLPVTLGKLPSLTFLSVNGNLRLSSLDVLNGSTSLITLQGSNCMIDHLPSNIQTLRTIEMDSNQLTSLDGLETIASYPIDSFSFRSNKITSISAASLRKIDSLNYFYLSNNLLTTLPYSLYQIKELGMLDIHNNNFDEKEREWIQGLFRLTNTTLII